MINQTSAEKTAVVFGATGLVGRELLSQLISGTDFEQVVAVVRRKTDITDSKLSQIIVEDFSKLDEAKENLKAAVYFCCIGTTINTAGSKENFLKVDLEIPKKIARLAEILSVPAMVVISSIGANASSSNFYLRAKGEMEESVRAIYKGKLRFVRPSLLMGNREEFRFGEKLSVAFMKIFGWAFIGPLRKYRGIMAGDVAKAMMKISWFRTEKMIYESDELLSLK